MGAKNKFIVGLLLILGLVLPVLCLAQPMDPITAGFLNAFSLVFGFLFNVLALITGTFLGAAVALFQWVTSADFISLPYTSLDNPFIALGWTLTRDLTNIIFVLALVFIGLGTALRRTGYQAQKALPILIIIALLINFTPIILGLIVDATNIVINFFVQGGSAGSHTSGETIRDYSIDQWKNIGPGNFWDPIANITATAGTGVLIYFNLFAGFIYFLFSVIFIFRYLAIWILTILSPFAFACYILPATRNIFSQWWKVFIQWSFIGVIASFFLYLGNHFIRMALSQNFLTGAMSDIPNASGLGVIITAILPYFIAIAFLFIGLFVSLTFAPAGADAVIKAFQTGGKAASKTAASRGWGAFLGIKKRTTTAAKKKMKRATRGYRAGRALGLSRRQALGEAAKRRWQRRIKPALRPKTLVKSTWEKTKAAPKATWKATWKETKAATKGAFSGVSDVVKVGALATFGMKLPKKKGFRKDPCPGCGNTRVAASAKSCTACGYSFE